MLEHQKIVLQGVSKDAYLFNKELKKSFGWLSNKEVELLDKWLKEHFSIQYTDYILESVLHQHEWN